MHKSDVSTVSFDTPENTAHGDRRTTVSQDKDIVAVITITGTEGLRFLHGILTTPAA